MPLHPINGIIPPAKAGKVWLVLVLVLAIAGILTALVFVIRRSGREQPIPSASQPLPTRQQVLALLQQDDDADGLKNWEEELYRTDPQKSDTDGDGTNDGEEIAQNRDPLKPGPNDQITAAELETKQGNELFIQNRLSSNLTERLARSFGNDYLLERIQNPGIAPDPERILDGFLLDALAVLPPLPSVSESDIVLSQDNSPQAVKTYVNAAAEIIGKNVKGLTQSPLLIFSQALPRGTPDLNQRLDLSGLDPYIAAYKKSFDQIKLIAAPSEFKNEHLALLTILLRLQTALTAMREADQDIIKAAMMVQPFAAMQDDISTAIQKAKIKLAVLKVEFSAKDPARRVFGL